MSRLVSFSLWAVSAFVLINLLTMPVSTVAQIVMACIAVLIAAILKTLRPDGALRMIALAIATSVVIRYIFWRATETLPPVTDLSSFIPGILLFAAECYAVMMLGLSLFVVSDPYEDRPTPDIPDDDAPTVDVFIPTYNEPADMLERTLVAALSMDYPKNKFAVFLLDDGGTEQKRNDPNPEKAAEAEARHIELQELCRKLGAIYLTRAKNEHAKAGNLNNGMEHSFGDLIAVFDADHVPAPEFLRETAGHYLEDPDLFLVQTPHFFTNPDPVERNLGLAGKVPSENEMFYGAIQRGLDRWNASFFCGSAALLSRRALEETDGFSGQSITEDCETAVALHSRGWNSRYVARPMISGLQPETFSSFIGQRSRWAQGMVQILLLDRPQLKRGLSFGQRLSYSSSIMFWLFPFARLAFLLAPIFYLVFNRQIFIASGSDFFAYTVTYMVASLIIQNLLYGSWRRPWMSEVYEFAQSFHLGAAIVSTIMKPRAPTFRVTAKDEISDQDRRSELAPLFYGVFFVLLGLQVWGLWRMATEPENFWLLLIVSGWNFLNLLLSMSALGVVNEVKSKAPMVRLNHKAMLSVNQEVAPLPITLTHATTDRLCFSISPTIRNSLKYGDMAQIELENGDSLNITLDDLRDDLVCGEFRDENPPGVLTRLIYAEPTAWRAYDMGRAPTGILRGTWDFIALSVMQGGEALIGRPGPRSAKSGKIGASSVSETNTPLGASQKAA